VSPAVDGGPDDGPVARGTSGGEGPKKRKNGGAGSDGSEPEGGQPHWSSQSGPGDLRRVLVEEKPSERVWLPPLKLLLQLSTLLLVFFLPFLVSVETVVCFFYTMHLTFYTVPHTVPLLTLLAWLVALCCRFATKL